MFSSKDLKVKLVYMGFGGLIAIIGMLFGIGMLSSVTAQRDKFGAIECTSLRVVDAAGEVGVWLTVDAHGGGVSVHGTEWKSGGKAGVLLGISEAGGYVDAYSKEGTRAWWLGITKHGGSVRVSGKGEGKGQAIMGINEYGNGVVSTIDKNGYRQ